MWRAQYIVDSATLRQLILRKQTKQLSKLLSFRASALVSATTFLSWVPTLISFHDGL